MAFSITPTTAKSGETITAKGTGTKKRPTRIRIDGDLVVQFTMPASSRFTQLITVPTRTNGVYLVVLQQEGTDNIWRQTASTSLTINNPIVEPPPPPPPPVDPIPVITLTSVTPNTTGAQFKWHVSEFAKGWIEYGFTTAYGSETPHENSFDYQDHIQSITGQPATTTIYYRIVAEDSAGQKGYLIGQFTTIGTSPTLPPAPSNLTATGLDKSVRLGWGI
jgi:hypothetical protein